MILHLIRTLFMVVVLAMTISFAFQPQVIEQGPDYITLYILLPVLAALGVVLIDMFWRRKRINLISGLFFGLLAGLAISYVLSLVVDLGTIFFPAPEEVAKPKLTVEQPKTLPQDATAAAKVDFKTHWEEYRLATITYDRQNQEHSDWARYSRTIQMIKAILGAIAVFLCITFVMQTKDEFRFIIPYVEFSKQTKGAQPLLLDTSVVIDGRIADIVNTNILQSEMIVPRFILAELQAIADSSDKLKRNRGRRGLDVLQKLQNNPATEINLLEVHVPSVDNSPDVDSKLVALAQHLSGRIMTNDYNLNKIAQLRGIDVININDLSNALKPIVLPGEALAIRVQRPGEEAGQGVGYLDDGTMVVVEQARDQVGQDITLVVTSALQTSAGRMIFGRLESVTPRQHTGNPNSDSSTGKA